MIPAELFTLGCSCDMISVTLDDKLTHTESLQGEDDMGRSITPAYRIETMDNERPGLWRQFACWDGKRFHWPTAAKLEQWRQDLNASFLPGGVNAHLSSQAVLHVYRARVIRQSDGAMVTETTAPTFEVL